MARAIWIVIAGLLLGACTAQPTPSATDSPQASPSSSYFQSLAGCLEEKGWAVEVYSDSVGASYPPEQEDQFNAAVEECNVALGAPTEAPTLSPAEAEEFYDTLLGVAECLRAARLPVDDPPSREKYVADQVGNEPEVWHPYDAAARNEQLPQAQAACPVPE